MVQLDGLLSGFSPGTFAAALVGGVAAVLLQTLAFVAATALADGASDLLFAAQLTLVQPALAMARLRRRGYWGALRRQSWQQRGRRRRRRSRKRRRIRRRRRRRKRRRRRQMTLTGQSEQTRESKKLLRESGSRIDLGPLGGWTDPKRERGLDAYYFS